MDEAEEEGPAVMSMLGSVFRGVAIPAVRILGGSRMSGPRLEDAIQTAARLGASGLATTLGYFDSSRDTPADIRALVIESVQAAHDAGLSSYPSIKIPPMHFDSEAVRAIVAAARSAGVWAHFDSHGPEAADGTLACVRLAASLYPQVGCSLPGRWNRSPEDARQAVEMGLRVRVVKGEWADPAHPTIDPRQGFMAVVDQLAGRAPVVAVASHDVLLVRQALRRLLAAGTPCELELLLGLPASKVLDVAEEFGVPVRMYVPFGEAWLPYAVGKMRQRPRLVLAVAAETLGGVFDHRRPRRRAARV
jgi:proline dehydrogenase